MSNHSPKRNIITTLIYFGSELTLLQRVVYALFSLILFGVGLSFFGSVSELWRNGDLLAAFIWMLIATPIFGIGVAGLINVLRFPKTE